MLEVGVGTGKNMPYYPASVDIPAIDLTLGMLERAKKQAAGLNLDVDLHLGDVQALDFPDDTFDDVTATFVFCFVPNPVLGLQEVARVLKPGGRLLLLERARSTHPRIDARMDVLDPFVVRLMGLHIHRRTVENVRRSGLQIERVEELGTGSIFKLIVAQRST